MLHTYTFYTWVTAWARMQAYSRATWLSTSTWITDTASNQGMRAPAPTIPQPKCSALRRNALLEHSQWIVESAWHLRVPLRPSPIMMPHLGGRRNLEESDCSWRCSVSPGRQCIIANSLTTNRPSNWFDDVWCTDLWGGFSLVYFYSTILICSCTPAQCEVTLQSPKMNWARAFQNVPPRLL